MSVDRLSSPGSVFEERSLDGASHRNRALLEEALRGSNTSEPWDGLLDDYGEQADSWQEWVDAQPHYVAPVAYGLSLLDAKPKLALEVGCGTGAASTLISSAVDTFIASDGATAMIHRTPGRFIRLAADVRSLPFQSNTFDVVVGLNAVPAFAEFARVLNQRGTLVWCSSFRDHTPMYVSPLAVDAALGTGWKVQVVDVAAGDAILAQRMSS